MMERKVGWRLAVMMALVYAVQGSFWPLLAVHLEDLGLDCRSRGWIFATLAMGSVIVPLGAGQLVDRLMRTQRFLALAYALGAALLALLASGSVVQEGWLFVLFLVFWMIIAPSYGLSNSLAMRHLDDPGRQFGGIRLWGTIGWMAAGWLVSLVMGWTGANRTGQASYDAFLIATVLSIIVALYCLTLPDTPPLARGGSAGSGARLGDPGPAPAAGCSGFSRDSVRRLPHHANGLPGHARISRIARPAQDVGLDRHDPGPVARDQRAGFPALAAGSNRLQGNHGAGHHRLVGAVPQPAGSTTAGHRCRRRTVARSGGGLFHCGRTGLPG
jgi:MFS family permease